MTLRAFVVAFAASAALSACASKPAPPHHWPGGAATNHIPMQGLPAVPRVIADEHPIVLENFGNESEREERRQAATTAGAIGGTGYGAVAAMGQLGPACFILPPLCIGLAVVGGAIGASASSVTTVTAEEADRLGRVFQEHATGAALQEFALNRLPRTEEQSDFPKLVVRVAGVILVPTRDGVSFRLFAEAQGFPSANQEWKKSLHFVQFASRSSAEWLAYDERSLKIDVLMALRLLSASIVPAYLPLEQRR